MDIILIEEDRTHDKQPQQLNYEQLWNCVNEQKVKLLKVTIGNYFTPFFLKLL